MVTVVVVVVVRRRVRLRAMVPRKPVARPREGRQGTFRVLPHTRARVNQTRTRPGMLYGHRNIAMLYGGPRLNLIYISALLHREKCEDRAE